VKELKNAGMNKIFIFLLSFQDSGRSSDSSSVSHSRTSLESGYRLLESPHHHHHSSNSHHHHHHHSHRHTASNPAGMYSLMYFAHCCVCLLLDMLALKSKLCYFQHVVWSVSMCELSND